MHHALKTVELVSSTLLIIIMLYTSHLFSVCQLYRNKTGSKTKAKKKKKILPLTESLPCLRCCKFVIHHLIDSSQESSEVKSTIWASIWEDSEMELGMLSFVGKEHLWKEKGVSVIGLREPSGHSAAWESLHQANEKL